jgi:heme a synthase
MFSRLRGLEVSERQFKIASYIALALLTFIVFTGAAVRLTDSGLGCPTWPHCYGSITPPLSIHPLIEFSNRAISAGVGVIMVVIFIMALLRKPYRADLVWLSATIPFGVLCQAVLGGFTVREHLAPGFVMSHFLLSMVILIFCVWLAWNATHQPGWRPRTEDRLIVWCVRGLVVLTGLTLFGGTMATAAGPHSGGLVDQHIHRLTIHGKDTLEWAVNLHGTIATVLGICTIVVWLLKVKRSGNQVDPTSPLTIMGILLAGQGILGAVQYELKLPAGMVWLHVVMATGTWLTVLWAAATEGMVARQREPIPEPQPDRIAAEWSDGVTASSAQ